MKDFPAYQCTLSSCPSCARLNSQSIEQKKSRVDTSEFNLLISSESAKSYKLDCLDIQDSPSDLLSEIMSSFDAQRHSVSSSSSGYSALTSACIERVEARRSELTRAKAVLKMPTARHRRILQGGGLVERDGFYYPASASTSSTQTARSDTSSTTYRDDGQDLYTESSSSATSFAGYSTPSLSSSSSSSSSFATITPLSSSKSKRGSSWPSLVSGTDHLANDKDATRELIMKLREERRRMQQGKLRPLSLVSAHCPNTAPLPSQTQDEVQSKEPNRKMIPKKQPMKLAQLQIRRTSKKEFTHRSRPSIPDAPITPRTASSSGGTPYLDDTNFSPNSAALETAAINARACIYATSLNGFSIASKLSEKSRHRAIPSSGFCFDYDPQSPFYLSCSEDINDL